MAHPGDWFLPKIHTPETGLRSILGWLCSKVKIKQKEKKKKKKSDCQNCLPTARGVWLCTQFASPVLLNTVRPDTETCPSDQH